MAGKEITRRLSIYINGTEVDATLSNLTKSLAKFRAQANRAVEGSDEWKEYNAEVARLEVELNDARAAQKAFRDDIKLTDAGISASTKTVTDFGNSIVKVFQGTKSGDYLQVAEGWEGITTGIKGATKATLAFIATPVGLILGALAGIVYITKEWVAYNDNIKESIILTEQVTKTTGELADSIRLRNQALGETFGTDEKETLEVARNLVQQFKITYEEAFDSIEDGLIKGQKNNREYLDSLREYGVFFAAAGFNVKEFQNIVAAGFDLGIYSDKLPDAIKEFDISIREQTKSTREALINAFGKTFTDDLLDRINTGKTTTKQALTEISEEAKRTGLNIEQNQRLTADVFRGAGEDVGGAIKIFEAVNKAALDANRALTPLEASLKRVADANLELAKAQDEALKSDNYISFTRDIQIFWTDIKTQFFRGVKFITDTFTNTTDFAVKSIISLVFTARQLPEILLEGLGNIKNAVFDTIKTFGGLGDVFDRIVNLDLSGAKKAAIDFKNNFTDSFDGIKTSAQDVVKEIINTQQAAYKIAEDEIAKRRAGNVAAAALENPSSDFPLNPNNGNDFENSEANDKATQKAIADALKRKQAIQDAIDEYDQEQAIRDQLKQIEKDEQAEEEAVIRKELEIEKLMAEAEGDKELLAELERVKLTEIQNIRDGFAEERATKEKAERDKLLAIEKNYKQQSIDAEANFQEARKNILNGGLSILAGVFKQETTLGKALFLFQKGKAIADVIQKTALANATIGASLATANSIAVAASPLTFGAPWVAINSANAAKNTAANNINAGIQIATIAGTALQGITSKEQGGETFSGPYSGGIDGRGGRLSILHPEEYIVPKIVRQDPEVPAIIDYLEQKRQAKFPAFANGGEAFTPNTQNPAPNTQDPIMLTLAAAINNLVANGVIAKTYYGIEDELKRKEIEDKLTATKLASKN